MKTRHSVAVLAVIALAFSSAQIFGAQASLSAGLAKSVVEANKKQTAFLKVGMTGFPIEGDRKRAGVNISLVIDRSGSMQGEKMERAKESAMAALDRLNSDDIVSVVVFDHTVEVLVPSTKLTDKEAVRNAIRSVTSRGSTALFAGVSKGAEEVRKFKAKERVNRVILLTDGQANIGPSSPSDLGSLGDSLRKDGISVTTLGLGSDYNEDLLSTLAKKSEGNHGYIANASDLARIFRVEFDDVLSVCAQEVLVKIECAEGVRPVRVLNRDAEIDGRNVLVSLSQLFNKQEKYAVLEVEIAPGRDGESKQIATVTGTYANMATKAADKVTSTVSVAFSVSQEKCEKSENRDALIAAVDQIALEKNKLATQLRDAGKVAEASKLFGENDRVLKAYGEKLNCATLIENATFNANSQLNLDPKLWDAERKNLRNNQYQIESQGNNDYKRK
ncbi:MAG: VWA domain-containing protein [Planctomycetota bacterium]